MNIQTEKQENALIFRLEGRFDAYEVPALTKLIESEMKDGNKVLVGNLSGVNFIDSSALAGLVQFMKRSRQAGGDLHLCELQQPVRIIFELTRLDKAFEIHPLEADALAALG